MPDMESGEKHHPIEAGQGVGTLCRSTALRAWHRGLHWCAPHWAPLGAVGHGLGTIWARATAHHWAPLGAVGHGLGTIWARATMAWGHSVRFDPRQGGAPVGGRPQDRCNRCTGDLAGRAAARDERSGLAEMTKAPPAGLSIWCIFRLVSVQSAYPSEISGCQCNLIRHICYNHPRQSMHERYK